MAGNAPQNDGMITGINVTPMVDIILVLLVIFIVTARIVVNPGVPLDLPQAATASEVQVVLSVTVPKTGLLQVNGETLQQDADLVARARAMLAQHRDLRALIQADGDAKHRRVLGVLDLLRQAGVEHVAFAAEPVAPK